MVWAPSDEGAVERSETEGEIAGKMQEVKDRAGARKPDAPMTLNVILRPNEIASLAEELAYDLGYGSVYTQSSLHKIGDDLQEGGDGDKLTITMKGVVEGSARSAWFDEDGMALTDTCVIENGVVKNYFGSNRFGQYLNIEKPSGSLPCLSLAPGSVSSADLCGEPCLDCVSMSGLQLDLYNDYIGGEIRLAYYFDGEKTVPLTGVTMSAKLSEVLAGMKLSKETTVSGSYEGPERVMLRNVSVL